MKIALFGVIVLFSSVVHGQQRNPNFCEGITGVDTFVNDFASCADYFWCYNGVPVPSGPCTDDRVFDQDQNGCSIDTTICTEECPEPVEGFPAIAVSGRSY